MDDLLSALIGIYNNFILRDLVGKIVPGFVLLISISLSFWDRGKLLERAKEYANPYTIVLLGGFLWIIVLAGQNISERMGAWAYFPKCANNSLDCQLLVQKFMLIATEQEKLQYERFVVIKEACGNLFFCGLVSIPFVLVIVMKNFHWEGPKKPDLIALKIAPPILCAALYALFLFGLFQMHWQHVDRQFGFVLKMLELHGDPPTPVGPGSLAPRPS